MRQSDFLGLPWSDVGLSVGVIQVCHQLGLDGVYSEHKKARPRRRADLSASTVTILRTHKVAQTEGRLLLGPEYENRDLVFCTGQGRPPGHRNLVRDFTALLHRTGVGHVSFHALRHTAATLLLLQGVHPKVVQERLGHSNIAITLDTYSHVVPSLGRDAADRLDALLG